MEQEDVKEKFLMRGSVYLMATTAIYYLFFIEHRIWRPFVVGACGRAALSLTLRQPKRKWPWVSKHNLQIYHSQTVLLKCEIVPMSFPPFKPTCRLSWGIEKLWNSQRKNSRQWTNRQKPAALATDLQARCTSLLLFSSGFLSHFVLAFKFTTFLPPKTHFSSFQFKTIIPFPLFPHHSCLLWVFNLLKNQWCWTQIYFSCYFLPSRIPWQPSDFYILCHTAKSHIKDLPTNRPTSPTTLSC